MTTGTDRATANAKTAPEAGTIVGVRQDVADLQVVRPDRVARIGEAPAGRAMAEVAQAQDAETARATAEAPAHGSPALRDRAGRAAAVGPPLGAEQLRGRDRARGPTARGGTRQSALVRVPTERDATRGPLRRPGRTEQGPRTIGPARACLLYTSPSPRDRTRSRM